MRTIQQVAAMATCGATRTLIPTLILVFAAATPMLAKSNKKTYSTDCDHVWAAVKLATAPPHYNFAQLDDAQKKGIVSTGNTLSGKRYLDITVSGTGNACTVGIGGSYSGLIHNDKGDLFARIKETLGESTPSAAPGAKTNRSAVAPDTR